MTSQKEVYVLIRTHHRPEEFARCVESVRQQDERARIMVISDDPGDRYVLDNPEVDMIFRPHVRRPRWWIRHHNPYNDYFNQAALSVPDGHFIYYLDDDDRMSHPSWIRTIRENDVPLLIGRFRLGPAHNRRIIGEEIVRGRIGGSCIAVQSHIPKIIHWPQRGGGDFMFIRKVAAQYDPVFSDVIAGEVQSDLQHSWGRRKHY